MQNDPNSLPPGRQRPNRTRLVGMSNGQYYKQENVNANDASINDIAMQPTVTMKSVPTTGRPSFQGTQPWNGSGNGNGMPGPWRGATPPQTPMPDDRSQFRPSYPISNHPDPDDADISTLSTKHLMQLSGMMRAVRVPQTGANGNASTQSNRASIDNEEGYWPYGIQRTGAFPVVNLYGTEPFGRTLPLAAVTMPQVEAQEKPQPKWKTLLNSPAIKVSLGLLVGIGLLFLVSRFVDLPTTIQILKQNLATPRGILFALLSGVAFLLAFSIRGMRWKLFINPIGKISTFKAIQLFLARTPS